MRLSESRSRIWNASRRERVCAGASLEREFEFEPISPAVPLVIAVAMGLEG